MLPSFLLSTLFVDGVLTINDHIRSKITFHKLTNYNLRTGSHAQFSYSARTLKLGVVLQFLPQNAYQILASLLRPSQSPACNHVMSGRQKEDTSTAVSDL